MPVRSERASAVRPAGPGDVVDALGRPRVLVTGDLMLDRYLWGRVRRISPEAPIPVLAAEREEVRLGGAANVAHNLSSLGARPVLAGVVGDDGEAARLRAALKAAHIDGRGLVADGSRPTTMKTRLLAQHQQMLRVDRERTHALGAAAARALAARLEQEVRRADLVLVSDYAKGALTRPVLRRLFAAARRRGLPVLVDPKGIDYSPYRGATALTPNQRELELATHTEIRSGADLERAAGGLIRRLGLQFLVVTRGEEGLSLFRRAAAPVHIPARAREVFDVTGAGDTVLAVLGMALASGLELRTAVALANRAAGIVVGKIGTAVLTRAELESSFAEDHREAHGKIHSAAVLQRLLDGHRRAGDRIVFTNGCFDLLHAGHVATLRFARSQGDVLIVAVNSDRSVRALKGPDRPVMGQSNRARILAAMEDVDYVVIFDEPTPVRLIRLFSPDVLVKGSDWRPKGGIVGAEVVRRRGGRVVFSPVVRGLSTTGLLKALRGGR